MAYSLMGIFDVNMPLLYGEGEKAFTRLQHEIVKISDDESIFAWEDDCLLGNGMFAQSPKAFTKSGDIYPIDDLHPLYVDRAPFAVTNKGLAIENLAHEKSGPSRVSDLNISLLPLNCVRQVKSGTKHVEESIMIELTNTSRDEFVRWSPRLLKPPRYFLNLTCPRMVYIRPAYTLYVAPGPPPLHINALSLFKRGLLLAETFNCRKEQEDLPRSTPQNWKILFSADQKFRAFLVKSSEPGCPALFGVILHTAGTIIDGIDFIVPSKGQTFLEEMNKYSQKCQPPVVTRAF